MSLATDPLLAPLPADRPAVERSARMPAGFAAAGTRAGIKASDRPDFALVVAEGDAVPAAAVFTPNRFAAAPVRLSRANLRATGGTDAAAGFAKAVVATSGSANAATGPDGRRGPGRDRRGRGGGARHDARARPAPLDRRHRRAAPGRPGDRGGPPRQRAGAGRDRRGAGGRRDVAAHDGLDDEDGHGDAWTLPGAAGGDRGGDRHGDRQGRRDDPPADGDDAVGACSRMRRRRPPRSTGSSARAPPPPGTSCRWTATPAPTTPCSCSRPAQPGRHRQTSDPLARATLAAAVETVARDLARQQAARRRGSLVPHHLPGLGRGRRRRRPGRRPGRDQLVARQGRDPRPGRQLGANRRGGRQRHRGGGRDPGGRGPGPPTWPPPARAGRRPSTQRPLRIAIAGLLAYDGARGGPTGIDKTAARAAMDAEEVLIRLDLGLGHGHGRGLRLPPHGGLREGERGVHDVTPRSRRPSASLPAAGARSRTSGCARSRPRRRLAAGAFDRGRGVCGERDRRRQARRDHARRAAPGPGRGRAGRAQAPDRARARRRQADDRVARAPRRPDPLRERPPGHGPGRARGGRRGPAGRRQQRARRRAARRRLRRRRPVRAWTAGCSSGSGSRTWASWPR